MIARFIETYKRLLTHTTYEKQRYIFDSFTIENRLTGLIGPRGTGKTTLLLQYIKKKVKNIDEAIYVSIDNIYFAQSTIVDFVNELYDDYGIRIFFFDEIHKYSNWNQELKNIYDSYPDIKIVFSGSSSIDLVKGTYDLSRRGVIYRIGGMSFREYLIFNNISDLPTVTFDEIIKNRSQLEHKFSSIKGIKGHFKKYLGQGYYPFILEGEATYSQKIQRIIEKTVYEDISNYYNLKTENLLSFKKIISYMVTIPPSKLNKNNISKNIGLDNKTVEHYLTILHETGLIELISQNRTGNAMLRNIDKIYLDNPDIYKSVSEEIGFNYQLGTIREIFFIKMIKNANLRIHFSKTGDFEVNNYLFEIGGKNKSKKQIAKNLDKAFLVKDDILYGSKHEIPLYLFGLLY
ncbi:MAG: AAA family ATPase [Kiritimatiellae bacterium]|jgi:predicted AAA+ superfamily ATPase|nr:AAA family ATPase [Kiritimatiellia bacterium]